MFLNRRLSVIVCGSLLLTNRSYCLAVVHQKLGFVPNVLRDFVFKRPMDAQGETGSDITLLSERLQKAERRLTLLNHEIRDIKLKIVEIQSNRLTVAGSSPPYSNKRAAESEILEGAKRLKNVLPMEADYATVYTDGACENNGKANAKAGIGVWFEHSHPLNVSEPVHGRATNNTAEIQACLAAAKIAVDNGVDKLCIKTDSQFVINSMTKWMRKWKQNNWKVAGGGDVKNKEDFVKLDVMCAKLKDVKWVYVAGHSGNAGNDAADALARAGAKRYRSNK